MLEKISATLGGRAHSLRAGEAGGRATPPILPARVLLEARPMRKGGPLTLVVVDDDVDQRELLEEVFASAGHRVSSAGTAENAVALCAALLPDLVVMDLGLPETSGVEAARRLMAHPRTRGVPIVALTAYSGGPIVADARLAGCDPVLIKPCSLEELLHTVERRARRQRLRPVR